MNLVCDKCGSSKIEDRVIDNFPNNPLKKMSEYAKEGGIPSSYTSPAVMRYYPHEVTCLNCGFKVKYTG